MGRVQPNQKKHRVPDETFEMSVITGDLRLVE